MKIASVSFFLLALTFLFSCEKNNFNYAPGTVGISKIVYFPSVTINGERLVIQSQGTAFTDPGANAVLNGQTVQYTTTGSVDPSTPGVYNLTYTASNPEGYTASDWRTVVIIGSDVSGNDFSGTYLRSATGVTSTWTKDSSGVYTVENPGGAAVGAGLTVVAVNYTGLKIAIPHQISPDYGEVSSQDETYTLTPPPPTYMWVFIAGGYGTSLRTFVKQ